LCFIHHPTLPRHTSAASKDCNYRCGVIARMARTML
jgi:hypothetical protein